jgi:hypothetical protein
VVNWIGIGIVAGLAAVTLQAAILYPSPLTALLFYLSALPVFVAGLGWGVNAAALAGLSGGLAMAMAGSVQASLIFLISTALPPSILSWLALRSRPADGPASEGEAEAQGVQWYPEGRLVLWAAAMAGGATALMLVMIGPDPETFRATLQAAVKDLLVAVAPQDEQLEPAQLDRLAGLMAAVLPLAGASVWLIATLANLKIGAALLAAAGRAARPWSRFGALAFPRRATWLLPVALVVSFLPGVLGFLGSVFAAALFTAFALLGLAVLHGLTEGVAARPFLLGGLYLALVLLNWVLVVPLAMLGLLDTAFAMRARAAPRPPPNRT